jgi:glycosyltransferase involved in cell wall biosynthesis
MKSYALICAYNEELTANHVIRNSLKYVDKVIFVNDGSKDKTLELAQKDFGKNNRVIIISYPENHGKGYAMITGFKRFLKENGDAIITLDADRQHDPDEIPAVMTMVENGNSDIVIGSRYTAKVGQPRLRVLLNVFSTMVLLASSGGFFTDVSSGFRCYSKNAVKTILPRLDLQGFGIEPEILQIAREKDLRTATIPVTCSYKCGKKPNLSNLAFGYAKFAFKYKNNIVKRILGQK